MHGRAGVPERVREPDDAELGRLFPLGDDAALVMAYERWSGVVHGAALRALGCDVEAEGVTRQVFVTAWHHRTDFRPEQGRLPDWIAGIAVRVVVETAARRRRERRDGPGRPGPHRAPA